MELSPEQFQTLHVLAYLKLRMGAISSAKTIYSALVELEDDSDPDINAHAGLAIIAIEEGNGDEALRHLRVAMSGVLTSQQSVFYLLKAQALWLEGRKSEAEAARDKYLFSVGDN